MAKKETFKRSRKKKAAPEVKFTIFAPCCSRAIDLILQGTDFSADIAGSKFEHVEKISLTSRDPMTIFRLSPKGVFKEFDPWRVYIVKGKRGETLVSKDGEIKAKSTTAREKKTKPKKKR